MKKLFTLAAAGSLALATLGAQAQITVNGALGTAETGTAATSGGYVLLGQYPYVHGFGPAGLLSLYGANTSTKVRMFVGGTLQPAPNGKNSFQLFLGYLATAGVASGTALPALTSNAQTTSFDGFVGGKLDQRVNMGIALHTNGTPYQFQIEAVAYTSATVAVDTIITATASPVVNAGTAITIGRIGSKSVFGALSGARFSYLSTSDGTLTANPGYTAPATAAVTYPVAGYGQAAGTAGTPISASGNGTAGTGTTGWEMELDRAAMGIATGNPALNVFVQQNNDGGTYVSSDYIPNAPFANSGTNLATAAPDYTAIAGTQSATLTLATVLATKAAGSVAGFSIFPNPSRGATEVTYQVVDRTAAVSVSLTDLLGRTVRTVENGVKAVGNQTTTLNTADLAAGTYLVRVQVGDNVSTSKISVL